MPAYVVFRGHRADSRSVQMIAEAERLGGPLRVTQGAYSTSVGASGGTHAGGGVFDFSVKGLTRTQINRRVAALRRVGFAAWRRTPDEGPWPGHLHAVAVDCRDLSKPAAAQVQALTRGRDGLAADGPDRHRAMGLPVVTWEHYLRQREDPDMTPEDIRKVAEAVWNYDNVPHNKPGARVNSEDPTDPANPTWRTRSVIEETENRLRVVEAKIDLLLAERT